MQARGYRVGEISSGERAVLNLCSLLFAEPDRLVETISHDVTEQVEIGLHRHDDVLQLDYIVGCRGLAQTGGEQVRLWGPTALAVRPGVAHGWKVQAAAGASEPGRVHHLKIGVGDDGGGLLGLLDSLPYPSLVTALPPSEPLEEAMGVLTALGPGREGPGRDGAGRDNAARDGSFRARRPIRLGSLITRLAEAITLWPTETGEVGLIGAGDDAIEAAVALLERRLHDPPTLGEMAEAAGLSPRHLARRFTRVTGMTPHLYLTARRLEEAKRRLLERRWKAHEIAEQLGFSSAATFSRWFTQHAGRSPKAFRDDPSVL